MDSDVYDWQYAQIRRLARHLGYVLVRPPEDSLIPLVDQVREADVVVVASADCVDALTLNAIMSVVPVESVSPRLSFARWMDVDAGGGVVIGLGWCVAVGLPLAVLL